MLLGSCGCGLDRLLAAVELGEIVPFVVLLVVRLPCAMVLLPVVALSSVGSSVVEVLIVRLFIRTLLLMLFFGRSFIINATDLLAHQPYGSFAVRRAYSAGIGPSRNVYVPRCVVVIVGLHDSIVFLFILLYN